MSSPGSKEAHHSLHKGFEGGTVGRSVKKERQRYKGVRLRSWGKWVSEIRLPNYKGRIWLGSFPTADMAARAYDAALMCIRGPSARFNFPHSLPDLPWGPHLSTAFIREAAAAAAKGQTRTQSSESRSGENDQECSSSLEECVPSSCSLDCSDHGSEVEGNARSESSPLNCEEETVEKIGATIDEFLALPPSPQAGEFSGHLASMASLSSSMYDLTQPALSSMPFHSYDDTGTYEDCAPFYELLLWNE